MFPASYFGPTYFAPRYFPKGGGSATETVGGLPARRRYPRVYYIGDDRVVVNDESEERRIFDLLESERRLDEPKPSGKRAKKNQATAPAEDYAIILDLPLQEIISAPDILTVEDFFAARLMGEQRAMDDAIIILLMAENG